jgi:hypothetical protein
MPVARCTVRRAWQADAHRGNPTFVDAAGELERETVLALQVVGPI